MQTDYQLATPAASVALGTHKVLRNTYMLLGLSMLPTVIGALVGMSMNFAAFAQHPIMLRIGASGRDDGAVLRYSANRNSSLGVVLLLVLTGFMGLILGPILQVAMHLRNGGQIDRSRRRRHRRHLHDAGGNRHHQQEGFQLPRQLPDDRPDAADRGFAGQPVLPDAGSGADHLRHVRAGLLRLHPVSTSAVSCTAARPIT